MAERANLGWIGFSALKIAFMLSNIYLIAIKTVSKVQMTLLRPYFLVIFEI